MWNGQLGSKCPISSCGLLGGTASGSEDWWNRYTGNRLCLSGINTKGGGGGGGRAVCATGAGAHQGQTGCEGERNIWWTVRTTRGGAGHLGLTHTETQRATACGQSRVLLSVRPTLPRGGGVGGSGRISGWVGVQPPPPPGWGGTLWGPLGLSSQCHFFLSSVAGSV